MKKLGIGCGILGVIGGIVLLFVLAGVFSYNRLVNLSQGVDQKWAQVQNNYQRRTDLIPNLVSTVSGAANFEKSTLLAVTQARASVGQIKVDPNSAPTDPKQLADFQSAQNQLGSALSRLLVVSERYPELRATQQFSELSAELAGTENRISVARMDFNDAVKSYNSAIKSVPGVFFAGMMGYKEKPYFQATAGSETPPKVQFDFGNSKPAAATN
jgi:LemA protein